MEELSTQESFLKLRESLLEQEKELVKTQNKWLARELEEKSSQLVGARKERAEAVADLEGRLASRDQEVCTCVCVCVCVCTRVCVCVCVCTCK